MALALDGLFTELVSFEHILREVQQEVDRAQVLQLLLEVSLALFAHDVSRVAQVLMNVVARRENDLNALVLLVILVPIDKHLLRIPVQAEHAPLWCRNDAVERVLGCFRWRRELSPVALVALVVRYQRFVLLTILLAIHPKEILDEARVCFLLLLVVALDAEREPELDFVQIQLLIVIELALRSVLGDIGVLSVEDLHQLDRAVDDEDADEDNSDDAACFGAYLLLALQVESRQWHAKQVNLPQHVPQLPAARLATVSHICSLLLFKTPLFLISGEFINNAYYYY